MACQIKIVPVRVHWYDDGLHAHATRVIGYRAVCAEHFRGSVRRSVQKARADAREHRASVEGTSDSSDASTE